MTGHWSKGAADTVAWVDLATWKLVTFKGPSPVADPEPSPWMPVAGDWDGRGGRLSSSDIELGLMDGSG